MMEVPTDALPPHSIEAEMCTLGSMLHGACIGAAAHVSARDFYLPKHAMIYSAIMRCYRNGAMDASLVHESLRDDKVLDQIGGLDYLIELAESVPTACHAAHYAKIVREKAEARRIIEASERAIADLRMGSESAESRSKLVKALTDHHGTGRSRTRSQAVTGIADRIAAGHKGEAGIPTGFRDVDARIGGLLPGKTYIFAGRPAMGKSAMVCGIAENVTRMGHKAAILSLEMDADDLGYRLLARMLNMPIRHIQQLNPADESDMAMLRKAADRVAEQDGSAELVYEYMPGADMAQIEMASRMHVDMGARLIVVDYMGLIKGEGRSRVEQVGYVSNALQRLAGQLGVPFLIAQQLNRGSERRDNKRPVLSDLRDSGEIEQDAYAVALIHRPAYYSDDPGRANQLVELIWAKGKSFGAGVDELAFDPMTMTFGDCDHY